MNLKTRLILIALAATAATAAAGWMRIRYSTAERDGANREYREVVDATHATVRVPAAPARIFSLCTSATDTIVALRAKDRLAAIDEYGRVVPGTEGIAAIGKGSAVSREKVAALGIDLAFVWWYQDDAAAMLDDLAIPTVRVRVGRAAEVPALIRLIGACLNRDADAEALAAQTQEFLDCSPDVPPAQAARVFLELYGPLKTVGRGSYMDDLLTLAGAVNVAGAAGSSIFSAEQLVKADPDVFLFVDGTLDGAALSSRPGMELLRAAREGRVFPVEHYWLVAGPHIGESTAKLRSLIAKSSNF
jgi:iron complex transport system substrate-binding protein